MIDQNDLLEPRKFYESSLKEQHHQNAVNYFDNLIRKSGIDKAANEETVKDFYLQKNKYQNEQSILKKKRTLRGFLIFSIVLLFIVAAIFIALAATIYDKLHPAISITVAIVSIAGAVLLIVFTHNKVSSVIKDISKQLERLSKEIDEIRNTGYMQCAALNNLLDWNMHVDLVNQTIPLFKLDKFFDMEKFQYLEDKFGFVDNNDKNSSTVHVQSGSILGNPFVIETAKEMTMGTYTYTGTLHVSYTVSVPNGKGGYRTETRSETLRASVNKPKPYYDYRKILYYGCEAAPKLTFSRHPSSANGLDKNGISKFVKSETKKFQKYIEKNSANGFTPLANNEFETLFHAWNRDNEVEFRLLFTPLAQKNILDLIKNKSPFGDDFSFTKRNKLNIISTSHSQYHDYVCEPSQFVDFDYRHARDKFVSYNDEYFQSFFFDMAPLLSIPLYQQYPTDDYIFKKKYRAQVTKFETEAIANSFADDVFAPKNCATDVILKSSFLTSEAKTDRSSVIAYGFKAIERVEYVPVIAGNGRIYQVPVHYLEYLPIDKVTQMNVLPCSMSRSEYQKKVRTNEYQDFKTNHVRSSQLIYRKGFYAFVPPDDDYHYEQGEINALLK